MEIEDKRVITVQGREQGSIMRLLFKTCQYGGGGGEPQIKARDSTIKGRSL